MALWWAERLCFGAGEMQLNKETAYLQFNRPKQDKNCYITDRKCLTIIDPFPFTPIFGRSKSSIDTNQWELKVPFIYEMELALWCVEQLGRLSLGLALYKELVQKIDCWCPIKTQNRWKRTHQFRQRMPMMNISILEIILKKPAGSLSKQRCILVLITNVVTGIFQWTSQTRRSFYHSSSNEDEWLLKNLKPWRRVSKYKIHFLSVRVLHKFLFSKLHSTRRTARERVLRLTKWNIDLQKLYPAPFGACSR